MDRAPQSYADLSAKIVRDHPDDWRGWVARLHAPTLPEEERKQAAEHAMNLAPAETEVIRVAASVAAIEGRWTDARELGVRAWLRGASSISDRVNLSVASAELGRCAEIRSWTPTSADDQRAFAAALDRMWGALNLAALPCAMPPVPRQ